MRFPDKIQKSLWVTDIHLKYNTLDITAKLFELILKTLKEDESIDSLIISGDTNDTKSIIRAECLDQLRNFLKSVKVNVFVLVGNHDMANTSFPELGHCLDSLRDIESVWVIDKPTKIDNVKMIPYIHHNEDLATELAKDKVDYVIAHNGISGAEMNTKGSHDDFSLGHSNFSNFKRVLVGHYHCYNEFENIVYLGSPFTHTFAEANIDKFIGIFDFRKNALELIETGLRKHRDYVIDSSLKEKVDIVQNEGDLVRITVKGKKDNNARALEKYKNVEAKFIVKNEVENKQRLEIDLKKDNTQLLNGYVKHMQKNTGLNLDKILEMGKKYLK